MNETELNEQVKQYGELRPIYKILAEVLKLLLAQRMKQIRVEAIVQARAKELPSFAEKAIRREKLYPDPVNMMNDLCGARVIVERRDQIETVCEYVRQHFQIDDDHPDDVVDRLGTNQFGYRARHLIVSLKPDEFQRELEEIISARQTKEEQIEWRKAIHRIYTERHDVKQQSGSKAIPVGARFKAEIQIKTLLEHAWASFAHDNQYKGEFKLPGRLDRDINRVSAALEEADLDMSRAVAEVDSYRSYYGRYMDTKARDEERRRLDLIFSLDQNDVEVAKRVARLALSAGEDACAEATLHPFIHRWEGGSCHASTGSLTTRGKALRDALAAVENESDPDDQKRAAEQLQKLRDGRVALLFLDYGRALEMRDSAAALDYLRCAVALDPNNLYAHVFLGELYYAQEDLDNALTCYGRALDLNQSDPEALCGYIRAKIERDRTDGFVAALHANIRAAILRCEDRASLGIYDPRVYCQLGLFYMFLDDPFASMSHFARAVTLDKGLGVIRRMKDGIAKLGVALHGSRQELEWARRLLVTAMAARSGPDEAAALLSTIRSPVRPAMHAPILIVAGGCNKEAEDAVQGYASLVEGALGGFHGTVLAGGTRAGIAQIIGDLPNSDGEPLDRLAYMPNVIPLTDRNQIHPEYRLHEVETKGYKPLLAIQVWVDILKAKIPVSNVRVLGVNGGEMSAFEYRLALAMDAKVGVIRGSGRAADAILEDSGWGALDKLLGLPNDKQTLKLFVTGYQRSDIPPAILEAMAQTDHEISVPLREQRIADRAIEKSRREDPDNAKWDKLDPMLQESIRQRIDHMFEKLKAAKLRVVPKDAPESKSDPVDKLTCDEIEKMAEMEHARYNLERLEQRFRLGKTKDWKARTNPTLVPWCELSDEYKKRDRDYVQQGVDRLKEAGYVIIRETRLNTP